MADHDAYDVRSQSTQSTTSSKNSKKYNITTRNFYVDTNAQMVLMHWTHTNFLVYLPVREKIYNLDANPPPHHDIFEESHFKDRSELHDGYYEALRLTVEAAQKRERWDDELTEKISTYAK